MNLADLRFFASVARHGSMNRAASELHTVQSNVTARIRSLEDSIGVSLFDRHARGVSLTPAGERMLPFVGRIAKLVAEAEAAARDDGTPNGRLLLGTLETTAALRLSPVLAAFTKAYPKVRLALTTGTTSSLMEDVLACRLDGAFVAGPLLHPGLTAEAVFREELVLVTPRSIGGPEALAEWDDLRTIVFRAGCSYRQRLDALLAAFGVVASGPPLEFGSLDAILGCVAAGIGVTLLPRAVAAAEGTRERVAIHELPEDRAMVETLLIHRSDAYLSSAFTAFARGLRDAPERALAAA